MDKFEAVFHCGDIEHGEETFGELIVSCCDGAVDLEVAEHALDAVALPIEAFVPSDRGLAVGFRRNDRPNAARLEGGANGVGVVGLVGEQGIGRGFGQIDQGFEALAVRRLAAGEVKGERASAGVGETMNFTGEPAPRAAKRLFASPPFAPAAETCPRTVVESML